MKTIAYLYKWSEKSTGMWYVGSRCKAGCHPDDGYVCSSKIVKPKIIAIPDDWERSILAIGNPKYIVDLETSYLTKYDAKNDPNSYNLHNNDGICNRYGAVVSDKTKAKTSKKLVGRKKGVQEIENIRISKIGKKRGEFSAEWRNNLSLAAKGKKKSADHNRKNAESNSDKTLRLWLHKDICGPIVGTYLYMKENFGVKSNAMTAVVSGKRNQHKGFFGGLPI